MRPWEGDKLCAGTTRAGRPCFNQVVRFFDYCLHHVPADQLDQAEAVAGFRLCRREPGCRGYAISWSWPSACKVHLSGVQRQIEYRQYRLALIETRRAKLMPAFLSYYYDGDRSAETLHVLGLDS
jgi:hypothetical protein